jgi:hypothetical protein
VEEYGVEEADMLLDPRGGWGELVTRNWLQLVLDARFATIEEKLVSLDRRFGSIDSRFASIDSRLHRSMPRCMRRPGSSSPR